MPTLFRLEQKTGDLHYGLRANERLRDQVAE